MRILGGDAPLNRCMAVRLGGTVGFAQIGAVGLDGQIEHEARYGPGNNLAKVGVEGSNPFARSKKCGYSQSFIT
jgi:hypothetical protein